jgi:hypothetical protein
MFRPEQFQIMAGLLAYFLQNAFPSFSEVSAEKPLMLYLQNATVAGLS